eukprot:COSAG01_NODE_1_length_100484_cov_170.446142_103_plen_201_part_00
MTEQNQQEIKSEEAAVEDENSIEDQYSWYILQCQTGKEYHVQQRILQLLEQEPREGKVGKVLIPEEDTIEIKNNKRVEKIRRIYPGYVFIQLIQEEAIFYEMRRVPGVAKFIGTHQRPTPVADDEILKVLRKIGEKTQKLQVDFELGETIKVIDGPFTGYTGEISGLNLDKGKLKSKILIFGRETPVELDFEQVERITNG